MRIASGISRALKAYCLVFILCAASGDTAPAVPVLSKWTVVTPSIDNASSLKAQFRGGVRMPPYRPPPVYRAPRPPTVHRPPVLRTPRPPVLRPSTPRVPQLRVGPRYQPHIGPVRRSPVFSGRPRLRTPFNRAARPGPIRPQTSRARLHIPRAGVRARVASGANVRTPRSVRRVANKGVIRRSPPRVATYAHRGTRRLTAPRSNKRVAVNRGARRFKPANDNRRPAGVAVKRGAPSTRPKDNSFRLTAVSRRAIVGQFAKNGRGAMRAAVGITPRARLSGNPAVRIAVRQFERHISRLPPANDRRNLALRNQIWSSKPGLNSAKNAYKHWRDHRKEFPELKSANQYVNKARQFLFNPPKGTMKKLYKSGEVAMYHRESNTFVRFNKNGLPKTMMRPKDGINYWNKQ